MKLKIYFSTRLFGTSQEGREIPEPTSSRYLTI